MKNKKLRKAYLIITSLLIAVLHLPVALAKYAGGNKVFARTNTPVKRTVEVTPGAAPMPSFSVYDSLHLDLAGLSDQAYEYAKRGYEKLLAQGKLVNDSILAIVDFSQPSFKKRLYILDMKNYKVLFNTLVAHGKNSGAANATSFSNQPESLKSSPGFYVTGGTYNGSNGYSLRLEGMDRGFNDNAYNRAIVMHGADYVSQDFINARGFIGRSWGCPAVPARLAAPIINTLKNGSCLFIYTPDQKYVERSSVLNS
jgi:hypothetical protein